MKLTKQQQVQLNQIGKKYQLKLAVLFGSKLQGLRHQNSDYDIAVLGNNNGFLRKKFGSLVCDLAQAFSVSDNSIDVSLIGQISPLLLHQINQNPYLLYGSQDEFDNFKSYCFKSYLDYQPYLKIEEECVDNFIKEYA